VEVFDNFTILLIFTKDVFCPFFSLIICPGSPILKFCEPLSTNYHFNKNSASLEAELLNNVPELDTKKGKKRIKNP